jgi:aspartate ammonia-lyase
LVHLAYRSVAASIPGRSRQSAEEAIVVMSDPRADSAFADSVRTLTARPGATRTETDSLGSKEIPSDAYWGIHVARALENFSISGHPICVYSDLVYGYACVKQAAARANAEIGGLDQQRADLIDRACEEIKEGRLHDQLIIDIIQGGAGVSTNMNFNEVIANRALELGGFQKAEYQHLDPNDHVNRGQSTHETYPTALKVGLCLSIERLLAELELIEDAFRDRARAFSGILKIGRTQLQDSVPMTLEQEFSGFADTLAEDHESLEYVLQRLWEVNLGATATGTGVAAELRYAASACKHLGQITGYDLVIAPNLIEATTDAGVFCELSGSLKRSAIKLSKICNDLRLLASGPQGGLGEIHLPARQASLSHVPGKVNPVIPEVVNEVAFVVAGGDVTLTMAAEAGQLQLNAFVPVMTHVLFEDLKWMTAAIVTLRENCIVGITADEECLARRMASFAGAISALLPKIDHRSASRLAAEALATNQDVTELVIASGLLSREAAQLLSRERGTGALGLRSPDEDSSAASSGGPAPE